MARAKEIPAAELEVLAVLWELGSGSVREVRDALAEAGRERAHTTVLTLLGRLEERGHVRCDRRKQPFVYRPRSSREKVLGRRLRNLVDLVGGGRALPLILQLMRSHELSSDDIRELRRHLKELERGGPER